MLIDLVLLAITIAILLFVDRRLDRENRASVDQMMDEILRLRVQLACSVPQEQYELWRNRAMALMQLYAPEHYERAKTRDPDLATIR